MTNFDVIGAVGLTMSAAILVAALSVLAGHDTVQRLKYSAILSGWFVIVVVLAATRALGFEHGTGAPGLGLAVVAPIALMWVALMRVRSLRSALEVAPLFVLVGVQAARILGVSFLILQAGNRLPAPFAPEAGWGDIVAGIAAVPVAWLVYRQTKGWRTALMAWNLFGLADLATAVSLGVLSTPGPLRRIFADPGAGLMTTLPWLLIPGFLVPLLATIHLAIFYRLIRVVRGGIPHGSPVGV
jgi:hypothetical protein